MVQKKRSLQLVFIAILTVVLFVSYLFYRSKPVLSVFIVDSPKATLSKKRYSLVEIVEAKKSGTLDSTVKDAPASESAVDSSEEFAGVLDADDPCRLTEESISFSQQVSAVLKAPDVVQSNREMDALILQLFNEKSPLNKEAPQLSSETNEIVDFFNALLAADLILGVHPPTLDYIYADDLFASLQKRNPDNGAYSYFRAYTLKHLGADEVAIKNEFIKTFESPYFNTYINQIANRLLQKSFANGAYLLAGRRITMDMPTIHMHKHYDKALKPILLMGNSAFNRKAVEFAETWVPRDPRWEFFLWSSGQYSVAHQIYKNAYRPMYTSHRIRPIISVKDFMKPALDERVLPENIEQVMIGILKDNRKPQDECDKPAIDRALRLLHENYLSYWRRR